MKRRDFLKRSTATGIIASVLPVTLWSDDELDELTDVSVQFAEPVEETVNFRWEVIVKDMDGAIDDQLFTGGFNLKAGEEWRFSVDGIKTGGRKITSHKEITMRVLLDEGESGQVIAYKQFEKWMQEGDTIMFYGKPILL